MVNILVVRQLQVALRRYWLLSGTSLTVGIGTPVPPFLVPVNVVAVLLYAKKIGITDKIMSLSYKTYVRRRRNYIT